MHCAYTGPQGVRRTSCWPLSADRAAPPRSQARRAGVAGGVGAPEVRHPAGVVLVPAARSRWPRSQQPVWPPITPGAHPDYSGLLPLGPRGDPSAGKGCLPGGGCCGALVPPQRPPISPHSRPSRYDRQIFVWKEHTPGQWGQVYQCREHEGSVNSIAWCPVEHGLCLACASSDGRVSVLTRQADDSWTVKRFNAHQIGCNAVSWAPAFPAGAVLSAASPTGAALQPMRLVTGGCDNLVKIWRCAACPPPPPPPSPPGRHLQTRWRFSSQVR